MHPSQLLILSFCACSLFAGPETNMKLVWSEDFNGPELDKKRWNITNADGVKIVDGQLSLEITPGSKPMFWRGSKVDTSDKYAVSYGFVEASIRFLQTSGHGCSFGVGNADKKRRGDRLGYENNGGDSVGPGLWIEDEERQRTLKPKENPIPKDETYSKKFHKFALWWTPSDCRWYVDGRLVQTLRQPPAPKPMHIGFDHSRLPEAGYLKKFPNPSLGPEPMRVDWVKVYQ